MKLAITALVALFFVFISVSAGTAIPGAKNANKTFNLNDAIGKNAIAFVSDAPMEKINGTADGVTGSFVLNPANLETTKGKLVVKVRNMQTAVTKRDEHMYSPMWLDADAYPTITYEIIGLTNLKVSTKDGRTVTTGNATGTFTMHGVTKPLSATVDITYLPESDATKKRATGDLVMVTATFSVPLKDFNVAGKEGVVGKSVGEVIQVTASVFANS